MNKKILLIPLVFALGACSTLQESPVFAPSNTYGYAPEDPCIRCGEEWVFINVDQTKEALDDTR